MNETYKFESIGFIRSCFRQKFGIPRQPGLVPAAKAILEILPPFQKKECFRGIEGFSHIWILFVFHKCMQVPWTPTVRPPRLGGNQRIGVFASRSGFRPNPIGQSAVQLTSVQAEKDVLRLYLKGVDLLDGTPVLDVKPYLPYADSIPNALAGYAPHPPKSNLAVTFSPDAAQACRSLENRSHAGLEKLIKGLLAQDPRPGYVNGPVRRVYGMRLWDLDVKFRFEEKEIVVESVEPYSES